MLQFFHFVRFSCKIETRRARSESLVDGGQRAEEHGRSRFFAYFSVVDPAPVFRYSSASLLPDAISIPPNNRRGHDVRNDFLDGGTVYEVVAQTAWGRRGEGAGGGSGCTDRCTESRCRSCVCNVCCVCFVSWNRSPLAASLAFCPRRLLWPPSCLPPPRPFTRPAIWCTGTPISTTTSWDDHL